MARRQGSYSFLDYEPDREQTEEELEIQRQMDGEESSDVWKNYQGSPVVPITKKIVEAEWDWVEICGRENPVRFFVN